MTEAINRAYVDELAENERLREALQSAQKALTALKVGYGTDVAKHCWKPLSDIERALSAPVPAPVNTALPAGSLAEKVEKFLEAVAFTKFPPEAEGPLNDPCDALTQPVPAGKVGWRLERPESALFILERIADDTNSRLKPEGAKKILTYIAHLESSANTEPANDNGAESDAA